MARANGWLDLTRESPTLLVGGCIIGVAFKESIFKSVILKSLDASPKDPEVWQQAAISGAECTRTITRSL